MIKSMTGYGKAQCQIEGISASIEVKSLNGKTLDINLKIPALFKSREQEIRSMIGRRLVRGKIEFSISTNGQNNALGFTLNKALLEKYYHELKDFAHQAGAPVQDNLIPAILRLPEVVQYETRELSTDAWESLLKHIDGVLQDCDQYRISEGTHLKADLEERIKTISGLLKDIPPLEKHRIKTLRQRLMKSLEALRHIPAPDPNRFEQEIMYYLEKLDITEEIVRLKKHLHYFSETMNEPEAGGKKLGFITQEIGREINTIGSKANDAAIQKVVVEMKDELEKIKEQLMNIL